MVTQISAETIALTVHQNTSVITTELLAQLYGTEANNIKVNFTRNADRFICGKHYFKVAGDELKNLRVTLSNSQNPISTKTRTLILWTERGAARHAKMLETDQAWEAIEKLEDCYFGKNAQQSHPVGGTFSTLNLEQQKAIEELVNSRCSRIDKAHQKEASTMMRSALKSHFGCSCRGIESSRFIEALSLVARLPLDGKLTQHQTLPPGLPHARILIAFDADGSIQSKPVEEDAFIVRTCNIPHIIRDYDCFTSEQLQEFITLSTSRLIQRSAGVTPQYRESSLR